MVAPLTAGGAVIAGRARPAEPSAQIATDGAVARAAAIAGEMRQVLPPSGDHPARTTIRVVDLAARTTVVRWPVVARPITLTASCDMVAGNAGPAGRQPTVVSAKMPTTPGCSQRAAISGEPVGVHAAAVSACTPQPRLTAELASARSVASVRHVRPAFALASMWPVYVSASSWPVELAPSAYGTSAKPGLSRLFCDHWASPSAVTASGENVSFWLGRKPVTSDVAPLAVMTSPALLATPAGVASF